MISFYKSILIKYLKLSLLLFFVAFSWNVWSQETDKKAQTPTAQTAEEDKIPTLSEIIPEVAELRNKLTTLEQSVDGFDDVSKINSNNKSTSSKLKNLKSQFDELKKEGLVNASELDNLKGELDKLGQDFNDSNNALKTAIETLEKSRKEWLLYQKQWSNYYDILLTEELPAEAKQTLEDAKSIIEKGLAVVVGKLNSLMKLQQNGYQNQSLISDLNNQILDLRQKRIVSSFEDGSIPMYSAKFYQQFNSKLWSNSKRGISKIILPSASYFQNYWWLFALQFFITLFVIYLVQKNSKELKNSKEYYYLNNRSISAGIFFGVVLLLMFHIDTKSTPIVKYLSFLIGGIAFCRLVSNKNIEYWKKDFTYALFSIIVISGLFHVFNTPVPIFRVFILLVTLAGLYKIYTWNKKNKETINSKKYHLIFTLLSVYLWIIVVSEVIGKEVLALYMYEALLKTIMILVFVYVFIKMLNAGILAGIKSISKGNENISLELINKTVNRVATIVAILVIMLGLIPRILVFWDVFNNVSEAYSKLMAIGFNIGEVKISLGILITSISILYGSYILATINEMVLMNNSLDKSLDKGTRLSIAQLLRYFLLFVGFLISISVIGFDLTNFTIVLSALSVGIGFGLQGLVNNFVSGLILLFERPIREGDTIEIEGMWSDVKKIGLRSTKVQTFDQSDVIIPNADLVYNKVTNWTLTNQRKRLKIAVGVAYGSDVNLVIETLRKIGSSNNELVKSHKPIVLFVSFADSTLNFELRVWAKDAKNAVQVESDLRMEIDKKFRENNIEIAFPQRDLHIRSVDKKAILRANINKNEK
jgi:small-conductance mechanosensitive channel